MYQHQVYNLFKELKINYYKFYNNCTDYSVIEGDRLYEYSSVAFYIDTQISLRESKN